MREVIRETGKILLLALIEELVRNLFPDYVVWVWMLALTYLTYELLRWKRIKKAGARSRERLSQRQNMWAYLVVAVFGAFLFIAFWYGVNEVYGRYTRILATKETKKESTQNEQAPHFSEQPDHPSPQVQAPSKEAQRKEPASVVTLRAYVQPNPAQPYPDGTKIGGIDWSDKYVDVRLDIQNGPLPIQDLDVVVGLDTSIAAVGQISQFQGISTFPDSQPPPSWLEGQTADGKSQQFPITPIPGGAMMGPLYRIHCAEIYRSTTINLVIASVALNPVVDGKFPLQLFAPRRAPTQIAVKGTYRAGSKTYPIELKEKF